MTDLKTKKMDRDTYIYENVDPSPRMDYRGVGEEEEIPTKIIKNVINLRDALGDEAESDYVVELQLVPTKVTKEHKQDVISYLGIPPEKWKDEDVRAWGIKEYGLGIPLWNDSGDDIDELSKEADEQAIPISSTIGFYLDKSVNRLGSTGWDMLRDALNNESWVDAGLRRAKEQRNKKKLDEEV